MKVLSFDAETNGLIREATHATRVASLLNFPSFSKRRDDRKAQIQANKMRGNNAKSLNGPILDRLHE